MSANPYQKYKKNQVEMASPAELTLLCYKGAIKHLKRALDNWENMKPNEIHESLKTVQLIIGELSHGLNEDAGEVTGNLAKIYEYMLRRLLQANVHKDPGPAEEVLGMFQELKETWEEAMKNPQPAVASSEMKG